MPICTSCTHPTEFLYTIYDSADNLRLEQCSACHAFADPYVEHDTLTLWIDLILLKRDVYRHLLFNRGTGARKISRKTKKFCKGDIDSHVSEAGTLLPGMLRQSRERERWFHILKLGFALVSVDAFIRWTHLSSGFPRTLQLASIATWNQDAVEGYLRIWAGCLIETLGFHTGVMFASFLVLRSLSLAARLREKRNIAKPNVQNEKQSGILAEFRYSHIPLSLLYSSLNKLFLLVLLAIWRPVTNAVSLEHPPPLPPQYNATYIISNPILLGAMELLDDDKFNREWVLRNILGGMAAGFGLRVVLDCHPIFTTMIILIGWAVKTVLANTVSGWISVGIGGNESVVGEMWLAYSIP